MGWRHPSVILACFEGDPVDFRNVDDVAVKRARAVIKRATTAKGATFCDAVAQNRLPRGCLDFTEHLPKEHLIVGYGYRYRRTTNASAGR
jgi:hypothetical protein